MLSEKKNQIILYKTITCVTNVFGTGTLRRWPTLQYVQNGVKLMGEINYLAKLDLPECGGIRKA